MKRFKLFIKRQLGVVDFNQWIEPHSTLREQVYERYYDYNKLIASRHKMLEIFPMGVNSEEKYLRHVDDIYDRRNLMFKLIMPIENRLN